MQNDDEAKMSRADQLKWAKGTKILEGRQPLVVYRGTGEQDDNRSDRKFWTPDAEVARGYATCSAGDAPHLFTALLNIRKPFDLDNDRMAKRLTEALGRKFDPENPRWELIDRCEAASIIARMGYDGVMFHDLNTSNGDAHYTYASFSDEQVLIIDKHAIEPVPAPATEPCVEFCLQRI
jgi:hypothetical protein